MEQEKERLKQDLAGLEKDMAAFAELYAPDSTCWRGEAAYEESCYVTADIDDLRDITAEIRGILEK